MIPSKKTDSTSTSAKKSNESIPSSIKHVQSNAYNDTALQKCAKESKASSDIMSPKDVSFVSTKKSDEPKTHSATSSPITHNSYIETITKESKTPSTLIPSKKTDSTSTSAKKSNESISSFDESAQSKIAKENMLLKKENQERNEQINIMKQENKKLIEQNNDIKYQLENIKKENNGLKMQIQDIEKENEKKNNLLQLHMNQSEIIQNENKEIKTQFNILKNQSQKIEKEKCLYKKISEIMMKILQKQSKISHISEEKFIDALELGEFNHVKYLSQNEILEISIVERDNKYYVMKKFLKTDFKEFKKFYREFDIVSSIIHPCISKFYRFTNSMEEIENPLLLIKYYPYNLNDIFKDKTLKEKIDNTKIVEIIIDILYGLKFLHEKKNIMHRNLKPENILLTKKFQAKIADFAWANEIDPDINHTQKDTKSITYMAPELINGNTYTEKVDQYSFGRILNYILSGGKTPYFNVKDIKNGITFQKLSSFTDLASEIMCECCAYSDEKRPLFSTVLKKLENGNFNILPNVDAKKVNYRIIELSILEKIDNS